jgi:hypothetical protein
MNRVHLLMDHRTNRQRFEQQLLESGETLGKKTSAPSAALPESST